MLILNISQTNHTNIFYYLTIELGSKSTGTYNEESQVQGESFKENAQRISPTQ